MQKVDTIMIFFSLYLILIGRIFREMSLQQLSMVWKVICTIFFRDPALYFRTWIWNAGKWSAPVALLWRERAGPMYGKVATWMKRRLPSESCVQSMLHPKRSRYTSRYVVGNVQWLYLQRFKAEAEIWRRVYEVDKGAHILTIYGFCQDDGGYPWVLPSWGTHISVPDNLAVTP